MTSITVTAILACILWLTIILNVSIQKQIEQQTAKQIKNHLFKTKRDMRKCERYKNSKKFTGFLINFNLLGPRPEQNIQNEWLLKKKP